MSEKININDGMDKAEKNLDLMRRKIDISEIVENGCWYIENQCNQKEDKEAPNNRIILMNMGAGELIIDGMKKHKGDDYVKDMVVMHLVIYQKIMQRIKLN